MQSQVQNMSQRLPPRSSHPGAAVTSQLHGIVIGVDFGTTYTGISWALTAAPEDIFVVKSWPTKGNSTYEKVPSQISYAGSSCVDDEEVSFEWGFKAQKYRERLQWIKLLLDPSQNSKIGGMEGFLKSATTHLPEGKTAYDVVVDFFTGLRGHIHEEIRNKLGEEFLQVTPKLFVFTVPAMWSDKAKELTAKAAHAAGFTSAQDTLRLVPEPEAAALCCLRTIQPNHINVGDNFVIADCGGGTCDLISYQVSSLSPMVVKESAVGTGELCGSVFLNTLFENFVKERMGEEIYDSLTPSAKELMMKTFDEDVKRAFSDDEDEEVFTIPVIGVQDNAEAGIDSGLFVLTRDELRDEIFAPVIGQIEQLVDGQVDTIRKAGGNVKSLLLVGGFGSSPYLMNYFKDWAEDNADENGEIQVLQPKDAWSCIVRGAVINGLEGESNLVKSRLTRRFYGAKFIEPFQPGIHSEKYRWWNEGKNAWYCRNRVKWFIQKGEKIEENNPIERVFTESWFIEDFELAAAFRISRSELLAYDGDFPPKHSDEAGVYPVALLRANLSAIPDDSWTKRNYGGRKDVMELPFSYRMIVHGGQLKFQLWHQGRQYGSVSTKFDYIYE